jgi:hypothetical protein
MTRETTLAGITVYCEEADKNCFIDASLLYWDSNYEYCECCDERHGKTTVTFVCYCGKQKTINV